jgi:hypothetical protein
VAVALPPVLRTELVRVDSPFTLAVTLLTGFPNEADPITWLRPGTEVFSPMLAGNSTEAVPFTKGKPRVGADPVVSNEAPAERENAGIAPFGSNLLNELGLFDPTEPGKGDPSRSSESAPQPGGTLEQFLSGSREALDRLDLGNGAPGDAKGVLSPAEPRGATVPRVEPEEGAARSPGVPERSLADDPPEPLGENPIDQLEGLALFLVGTGFFSVERIRGRRLPERPGLRPCDS